MESKLEELTSMNTKLGKELKEVSAELGQTKLANQVGTSEIVQLHATIAELQGAIASNEASNAALSKIAGKSAYNGGEAKKWRLQAHDLAAQSFGVVGAGRDYGMIKSSCTSRPTTSKLGFKSMGTDANTQIHSKQCLATTRFSHGEGRRSNRYGRLDGAHGV